MWILSLLARSPKNGAELMDTIEETSQGWWRPSPGSIYPLLESLQKEGLIKKKSDGRYELTESSREEMGWPGGVQGKPQDVESMLKEMSGYVSYFEDVLRSDKSKVDAHKGEMGKIAQRLLALAREGGEKK